MEKRSRKPRVHKRDGQHILCWGDNPRLDGKPCSEDWNAVTCSVCLGRKDLGRQRPDGCWEIRLSNAPDKFAIVDAEDYQRVSAIRWNWHRRGNHARGSRREGKKLTTVYMHREIMNPPKGMTVDHINSDGLDNRRANLRICTQKDNTRNRRMRRDNTSGYRGVCFVRGKYIASVQMRNIGAFKTAEEAARAYDAKALEVFGEFAKLNFSAGGRE